MMIKGRRRWSSSSVLLVLLSIQQFRWGSVLCFSPNDPLPFASKTHPSHNKELWSLSIADEIENIQQNLKNGIAAMAVAFSVAVAPKPALADYEISKGALVIETSVKSDGQSLLNARVDAKKLLGKAFENRKELIKSLDKITSVVKEESTSPAVTSILKEFVQVEEDVVPGIQISPPSDLQQLIKDVANGRLNIILDGELINVSIDDKFTDAEDEIVLNVKGIKGFNVKATQQERVKSRLEDQIDALELFWNSPLTIGDDTTITNGEALGGSVVALLATSYGGSYAYYVSEREREEAEAEAKRNKVKAKKKEKEIADKKSATEQKSSPIKRTKEKEVTNKAAVKPAEKKQVTEVKQTDVPVPAALETSSISEEKVEIEEKQQEDESNKESEDASTPTTEKKRSKFKRALKRVIMPWKKD